MLKAAVTSQKAERTSPNQVRGFFPSDLKAYFVGCALTGRLASQEDATFQCALETIVDESYQLGELLFKRYVREFQREASLKQLSKIKTGELHAHQNKP